MSIRQKTLFPLLIAVVILGIISFVAIYWQVSGLRAQFVNRLMKDKQIEIEEDIKIAARNALEMASLFTKKREVLNAYKVAHSGNMNDETDPSLQKARDMLRHDFHDVLAGFSGVMGGRKLKLHFHLPNGRSLVRLWRSKQTKRNGKWIDVSDDISGFRQTVLDVNHTGRPVEGIELGRGGFVIRGVAPIKSQKGDQLGSVETLTDFKPILQKVSSSAGQDVRLYMNAEFLGITRRLQDPKKYPVLDGKYVKVFATDKNDSGHLVQTAFLDQGREGLKIVDKNDKSLGFFPVRDYKGKQVGVLMFILDTTAIRHNINIITWTLGCLLAGLLLFIGVISQIVLNHAVIRPVEQHANLLREGAGQVASASEQLATFSQSVAEGASSQAASIEETSSSIEEITAMTRESSGHAAKADNLMKESVNVVERARQHMEELTNSMGKMAAASQRTSMIIKTIDEIAFQTNLLALNAAVEAARAGEIGAGFAVVADEVRNLAMRTAEAAGNTAELIKGTVEQIEEGTGLVSRTSEDFSQVSDRVAEAAELISSMGRVTSEQKRGMEEMSRVISEMDHTVQGTAADSEKTACASEQLSAQAEQMKRAIEGIVDLLSVRAKPQNSIETLSPNRRSTRL